MKADLYQQFEKSMQALALDVNPQIAVGVSGGSDSLALLYCLAEWAKQNKAKLFVLTVDHKLRKEAAEEAKKVALLSKDLGLNHKTLVWEGEKPKTGIQEKARKARFDLMLSFCKEHNFKYLALAHHLEDQAETFLIRLGRGSGVDGLCAMRPVQEISGISIIRPLLDISHKGFKSFLKEQNVDWVEDPSNSDEHYQRVRIRKLLPTFEKAGLSSSVLAKTAEQMQRVRSFLDTETNKELAKYTNLYDEGYIEADPKIFFDNDDEIIFRCLKRIIMCIGGLEYPLRLEKLSRLSISLKDIENFKGATLGGCQILKKKKGSQFLYQFVRELKKVETITVNQDNFLWDQRFSIDIKKDTSKKLFIKPLGGKLWKKLVKEQKNRRLEQIPRLAGICLPALFDDKDVLLVPHLGYKNNINIEMKAVFNPVYKI